MGAAASGSALVLGGTGYVGGAVVRALAARGVEVVFGYHQNHERAAALCRETGARSEPGDLSAPDCPTQLVAAARDACGPISRLVHAATELGAAGAWADDGASSADFDRLMALEVRSAWLAAEALVAQLEPGQVGEVILTASVAAIHSIAVPAPVAAAQAARLGLVRGLAKALGPRGVRVNLVVLGVLEDGIAKQLAAPLRRDFLHFSALRRPGTAEEAAEIIAWLATENRYMTGATVQATGGI
ncbi:MAG: SDR family oxidoreductase [Haliangiales bacterium]